MPASLTSEISDQLTAVGPAAWKVLFPSHPDSFELVRLVEDVGIDGFGFHSIVVRLAHEPILLLPLFHTALDLPHLTEGRARQITTAVSRIPLLGSVLRPRLVGVGFVEGEWGEIGIKRGLSADIEAAALRLARKRLREYASGIGAQLTLFLNFTDDACRRLADFSAGLSTVDTYPCARLPVAYSDIEQYIASLSRNARKDLRRKARMGSSARVVRTTDVVPHLARIYELYAQTVDRAEMSLGRHRMDFFERCTREVPGAYYVLYFEGDRLIAFNLLVNRGDVLVDKYFCMEEEPGRRLGLYFLSWIENVRWCIANAVSVYHAGPGSAETKARLGSHLSHSHTFFRHRNPIVHAALNRMRGLLASASPEPDASGQPAPEGVSA